MAKVKSYVSDFVIRFGPATTHGRLAPVKLPSKEPKFKYCTPEGKAVKQVYTDDDSNIWTIPELQRAIETEDGELKLVDKSAVEAAKTSDLPLNVINLTAHSASDVERHLFPSNNNAYIFEPSSKDPANVQWHDFLNVLVRDSGMAFVGMCNLRNYEGLFRVNLYQGYLTIQKQMYPEELNQFEQIHPEVDAAVREKAFAITRKLSEDFDPSNYRNRVAERLTQVADEEFDIVEFERAATPSEIDLMSALEAFDDL